MREILFKAKCKKTNKWVFGYYKEMHTKSYILNYDFSPFEVEVIPETVSQFTGLIDKNGVKIFEGDLLQIPGYYCEVKFIDGMFCSVYNHPEDGETLPLIDLSPEIFEIIGNIHDDAKL